MAQSLVSETIPKNIISDLEQKVGDAITAFKPYAVGLSPKDRREIVKLGDKSVPYAEKVSSYINTNGDYLPRRFDPAEFAKDFAVTQQLAEARARVQTLLEMIEDTIMAAGSDVMIVCNAYYNAVQDAVHDGDAGAKAIYEDLKARYPYTRSKEKLTS